MNPSLFFKKKNAGFTLTEMLVALVIFVLIVVAIYSTHTLTHRAYLEGERAAEITQNGRVILERMTREIRQAKEVVGLSATSTGATSTIEFEDGHDTSYIHYIRYFKDGTDVKREELAYYFSGSPFSTSTAVVWNATDTTSVVSTTTEQAKVIGEYVAGLDFWGSSVINVSTTLEKDNKKVHLKTKVFGRNL